VLGRIAMRVRRPHYVGRPEAASPATGQAKKHIAEQIALVADALHGA
jgi:2-oxoglutarate dehydrogenase E1 component